MPAQKPCSAVLPPGFTVRPFAAADGAVVADLLNDYIELAIGLRKVTADELGGLLSLPGFDAENSTRLVLSPQGRPAGTTSLSLRYRAFGIAIVIGAQRPVSARTSIPCRPPPRG